MILQHYFYIYLLYCQELSVATFVYVVFAAVQQDNTSCLKYDESSYQHIKCHVDLATASVVKVYLWV